MRLNDNPNYKLDALVQWIDSDTVMLRIVSEDDQLGTSTREYFFTPQHLAHLAEYINDTLCL